MNALATAADFKNGFGTQFVQPFPDTDALYSSYSHYNNWAAKVPSPLGAHAIRKILFDGILMMKKLTFFSCRYKDISMAGESIGLGSFN